MFLYVLGIILSFSFWAFVIAFGYSITVEDKELLACLTDTDYGKTFIFVSIVGSMGLFGYNCRLCKHLYPSFLPILVMFWFISSPLFAVWILVKGKDITVPKHYSDEPEDSAGKDGGIDYMQGADPDSVIDNLDDAEAVSWLDPNSYRIAPMENQEPQQAPVPPAGVKAPKPF